MSIFFFFFCFFFNDTATTEIYTLSLHDALPVHAAPSHHRILVASLGSAYQPALGSDMATPSRGDRTACSRDIGAPTARVDGREHDHAAGVSDYREFTTSQLWWRLSCYGTGESVRGSTKFRSVPTEKLLGRAIEVVKLEQDRGICRPTRRIEVEHRRPEGDPFLTVERTEDHKLPALFQCDPPAVKVTLRSGIIEAPATMRPLLEIEPHWW